MKQALTGKKMSYIPAPLLSAPSCWQQWVCMFCSLVDEPLELALPSPSTPAGYIVRAGWDNLPTWEVKYHPCPHRWPTQRQVNFHSRLSVWEAQEGGDDKLATVCANQEEMWEGHSFGSERTAQQCESSYLSGSQGQLSVNIAPHRCSFSFFASFHMTSLSRKCKQCASHSQKYGIFLISGLISTPVLLQDILFLWINTPGGEGAGSWWHLSISVWNSLEWCLGLKWPHDMSPYHHYKKLKAFGNALLFHGVTGHN